MRYLKFDESSGTIWDTTNAISGVTTDISYDASGRIGRCMTFNGTSSSIEFGTGAGVAPTSAISISFWYKASTPPADYDWIMMNASYDTEYKGWQIQTYAAGAWGLMCRTSGGFMDLYWGQENMYDGNWHHYAFTWNGTNIYHYEDNTKTADTPTSGTITYSGSEEFTFGKTLWDGYFLTGSLDEIGIWNRVLSDAEVAYLYNSGSGRTCSVITTPTPTPSQTPSLSISPTRTPSPSLPAGSPSITPTQTPSLSISATPSLSISATPSLSISATRTPSLSVSSVGGTPSLSISATPSLSISATPSLSVSRTRTPSMTPSMTPSLSISATPSLSISKTPSLSISKTPSPSAVGTSMGMYQGATYSSACGASSACVASNSPDYTVYMVPGYSVPTNGQYFYTDSACTTAYVGNNNYYRIYANSVWYGVQVSGAGLQSNVTLCSTCPSISLTPSITPTRTPSASPATGYNYSVDYYSCSGSVCGSYITTAQITSLTALTVVRYYKCDSGDVFLVNSAGGSAGYQEPWCAGPYLTCNAACAVSC